MQTRTYFLFSLFCLFNITIYGQTKFLEPNLKDGPHNVGFQVYYEYDYSRTFSSSKHARPIQISIWYPAEIGKSAEPMPFKNYIDLMATQTDFDYKGDALQHTNLKTGILADTVTFPKNQMELALIARTKVIRNAKPKKGSFPVVIYSPGTYGAGFENATMFEFLASHGFIIASFPSLRTNYEPLSKQNQIGPWTFETHSRDAEFVIEFLHKFPSANMTKLGIMGFSLGGTSVATIMSRNNDIKAAVNLDCCNPDHFKWMPFVDFKKENPPLLNFSKSLDGERENTVLYDSMNSQDNYFIVFKKFGHLIFGSSWLLFENHNTKWISPSRSQAEVNLAYNLISEYVLKFFEAYLNNDSLSKKDLSTIHNRADIPANFISFEHKEKTKR